MLGGRSYRRGIGDVDEPEAVGEDVVPDAVLRLAQVAIIFEEVLGREAWESNILGRRIEGRESFCSVLICRFWYRRELRRRR
jgi:hypothetical protein